MDKVVDFGITRISQEGIFVFFFAFLFCLVVFAISQIVVWSTKQLEININKLVETLIKIETSLSLLSLKNNEFETIIKTKISTLETVMRLEEKINSLTSMTQLLVDANYIKK